MNSPRQLTLDLVRPDRPSLENFIVGRNAEVLSALRAVAAGEGERFVYLWGEIGAGRSHLLQALGADPGEAAVPVFNAHRTLYLVDDVDRCDEQQLFVLLNEIRADGRSRFVATGSAAPRHLQLRDDVRTRLAWGLVYQIHTLSDDEKASALAAHAASRGVALPSDVIEYLLLHSPRDMRTLVAIVDAIDTYALAIRKPVTLALVRQWTNEGLRTAAP